MRLVLLVVGCVATAIGTTMAQQVEAGPLWICRGDTVTVRWTGGARADLLVEWSDSASGLLARDRLTAPDHPVKRSVTGQWQVRVLEREGPGRPLWQSAVSLHPDRMEHRLERAAQCGGRLSLTSMAIPPEAGSERIRPRSVTNAGDRPIWIVHRGVMARLEPGAESTEFNGAPFTGIWGVVVDTGAVNPFCPPGEDTAPQISVVIVTQCAR